MTQSSTNGGARFIALRLVVPDAAVEVELHQPEMVLGRHSDADVRLPMPDVSRRHCRFVFDCGDWHVWDLNSLNGVFVNGAKVEHAILRSRDVLGIGGMAFEVRMPGEGPSPCNSLDQVESLEARVAS